MTSSPITSWQIDGETVETVTDFIFLNSKITPDGDCSHEIKRCLLLGRKAMTNLDSILKSRDITLPTKVHLVKTSFSVSHVWMWELDHKEGWAPKVWCSELWCWGRLLTVPWTAEIKPVNPKGNQPWIFIERTGAEAETPVLWPPEWRADSLEKTWCWERLKAGGEGNRGWDGWVVSLTKWVWVWTSSRRWWRTGKHGAL